MWLIRTVMAGGGLALVVSGCGNTDYPSGPEWTSTAPAASPAEDSRVTEGTPGATLTESGDSSTTVAVRTATTALSGQPSASPTATPPTGTSSPRTVTTAFGPPGEEESLDQFGQEPPLADNEALEEKVITNPGFVVANDYWDELGLPDPAAPPVEDPERILYAEQQIQRAYFRWYDGIYRKDSETLRKAVTGRSSYEKGVAAMERMEFTAPPTLEGVEVQVLELYVDHADCLVAAYEMDISSFRHSDMIERITVLWSHPEHGWRRDVSFGWPTIYGDWWANCFVKDRSRFP